jgi:hypothetical protein
VGAHGFERIRRAAVSGKFYPSNPKALSSMINRFLKNVRDRKVKIEGKIVAIIVPHAGYKYSGRISAYSYKALKGYKFDSIIIIGPSHFIPFNGVSVYNRGYFETPLGKVPVDSELAEKIINYDSSISFREEAHIMEHSLEVQLPFLQTIFKDIKIVPIAMGLQDRKMVNILSDALIKNLSNKNVLIIASSDLSHYHPAKEAKKLDSEGIKSIKSLDYDGFMKKLENGKTEFCGGGAVAVALRVAEELGADGVKILKYGDSGDITGDKSAVVGYLSAVIFKGEKILISDDGKKELLIIARRSIEEYIKHRRIPEFKIKNKEIFNKRGVFVTLKKNGILRGCIGIIKPVFPLYKAVIRSAISSAFNDPRFLPLSKNEIKDIDIEISALSPLRRVEDVSEIKVGTHGILIEKGPHRGILLPQVAVEYRWDRDRFLEATCRKAGLPKDAWKKGGQIYIFTADIFNEDDFLLPSNIDKWKKKGKIKAYSSLNLFEYLNGGADIYIKNGFRELLVQEYSYKNLNITVEIYKMDNKNDAKKVYNRAKERNYIELLKDRYILRIYSPDNINVAPFAEKVVNRIK